MSARGATLQAQVESVLGTLVRAATLELIKLFESRYRASAADGGLAEDNTQSEAWGPPLGGPLGGLWSGDAKRNIGIQVEEDTPPLSELPDPTFLCDGGCLKEPGGVEVVGLTPPELLLDDDEGPVDPDWSPLKEQPVESRNLEAPADKRAPTEDTLHETKSEDSTPSPNASEKPLVIVPGDAAFGEDVKFVCPLILKSESPEKPVEAEPRPACAGTAEGTAYSPSPSDGAATPTRGAAWGRVAAADLLQAKLKLASLDLKLLRPCAVRLVDVLAARPGQRSPRPLPKDLRRHQGPHTGRRLCCFAPGGDGVWRLQTAAAAVGGDAPPPRRRRRRLLLRRVREGLPAPEGAAAPRALPHGGKALRLRHLLQDLRPEEEPPPPPALPHGRAAARLRAVRQELPAARQPEGAPQVPHGGEALPLPHLQQDLPHPEEHGEAQPEPVRLLRPLLQNHRRPVSAQRGVKGQAEDRRHGTGTESLTDAIFSHSRNSV
ncbi:uncharacterized protein ACNS7B_020587 [Menidia menidia]